MQKLILAFIVITFFTSCKEKEHKDIVNLARTSSSKDYPGFESNKLVDQNTETYWNAGSNGQNWVDFHFEKSTDISKIKLKIGAVPPCTFKYDVLVKEDGGKDYTNIMSGSKYINSTDTIVSLVKKESVSNIKIILNTDSTWINIMNAEIYN